MLHADLRFPPFALTGSELLRDGVAQRLRPKALALLAYLAARGGELVSKEELLAAMWPDVHVKDSVLKVCVRELREVLGDDPAAPRFIENVPRLGYRFVAPVRVISGDEGQRAGIVGRRAEIAELERALAAAKQGRRRVVLVGGEAGIGKTTLLDLFATRLGDDVGRARGQCIEQRGEVEPFMPIFECLTRLCRADRAYVDSLREHAPSWLLQLRGELFDREKREALDLGYAGATRGQMLRELVIGIEEMAAARPLCLLLEDLHWADPSTMDLLERLVRDTAPTSLLIVGTHRPLESAAPNHRLRDLAAGGSAHACLRTLHLAGLKPDETVELVVDRLAGIEAAAPLAGLVHAHTGGNPLFAGNLLERLAARGSLLQRPSGWQLATSLAELERLLPVTLQEALGERLAGLTGAERRLLEAAAASGLEFGCAEVAAAQRSTASEVARTCHRIAARRGLIRHAGEGMWPDGTEFERFEFTHSLIRESVRSRIEASRMRLLRRRIGEALESGHAPHTDGVAGALAEHFEVAADANKTARYRLAAGREALRRFAYAEATAHLRSGLAQLRQARSSGDADQLEFELSAAMGLALSNTLGLGASEVGDSYSRAFDLHGAAAESSQLFPVLEGLHSYYVIVGDFPRALELAQRMLEVANAHSDPTMLLESYHTLGCIAVRQGHLADAVRLLDKALRFYEPQRGAAAIHFCGHDARVCCLGNLGVAQWLMGRADRARRCADEGVAHAASLAHPYTLGIAHQMQAWVRLACGEDGAGRDHALRAVEIAAGGGFAEIEVASRLFLAWADARLGEAESAAQQARQLWELIVSGSRGTAEVASLVARVFDLAGWREAARRLADDALHEAARHGSHYLECDLLVTRATNSDAESALGDLRRARRAARRQGALALEMQAVQAEARLLAGRGEAAKARRLLNECRAKFEQGGDALPLREVEGILADLADSPAAERK